MNNSFSKKEKVKIPFMGESITSGILSKWNVKDGEFVKKGQILFELETDKITSEGISNYDGIIKIKTLENNEVSVNQIVAFIDTSKSFKNNNKDKDYNKKNNSKKNVSNFDKREKIDKNSLSPSVKRILANNKEINLKDIRGTGKDNRITKSDITLYLENIKNNSRNIISDQKILKKDKGYFKDKDKKFILEKISPIRKKIGERLIYSQKTTASLTTFNDVDMSEVFAIRKKYQKKFVEKYNIKLGLMSFFVLAVVKALKEFPKINSQIEGEFIKYNNYYDIGVAVSTEKGLVVPILRDCDKLSFVNIEKKILKFSKEARENKIDINDLAGGVFTISNGGVFGSLLSTPILNPPQSSILGMHRIEKRTVVIDDNIVIKPMMYLALTYDHRIIDGKDSVTFLQKIKEIIENPIYLSLF
jgi:2-oxoglutarate dehydrogenase E2 component (dihydrolipoamide succinyltransferase)